jgi:hypothetical protein
MHTTKTIVLLVFFGEFIFAPSLKLSFLKCPFSVVGAASGLSCWQTTSTVNMRNMNHVIADQLCVSPNNVSCAGQTYNVGKHKCE